MARRRELGSRPAAQRLQRTLPDWLSAGLEPALRRFQAVVYWIMATAARPLALLPSSAGRLGPPRRVERDAQRFAELPGVVLWPRQPEAVLERVPPDGGPELNIEFALQQRCVSPANYVLTIKDGRVFGADAAIVGPGDTFFTDVENRWPQRRADFLILRRAWRPSAAKVPGSVAVVAAAFADYYFHWLTEILPRFWVLGDALGPSDAVVVPATKAFQLESLERLGIDVGHILPPGPHYQADELVVRSLAGRLNSVRPEAIRFVRRLFDVADAERPPRDGRRLYVSRRFAEARVVVGPHGGGLTNALFCAPGTVLIELLPPEHQVLCFWTLASSARLSYHFLIGRKAGSQVPSLGPSRWQNIEVDGRQLADCLRILVPV